MNFYFIIIVLVVIKGNEIKSVENFTNTDESSFESGLNYNTDVHSEDYLDKEFSFKPVDAISNSKVNWMYGFGDYSSAEDILFSTKPSIETASEHISNTSDTESYHIDEDTTEVITTEHSTIQPLSDFATTPTKKKLIKRQTPDRKKRPTKKKPKKKCRNKKRPNKKCKLFENGKDKMPIDYNKPPHLNQKFPPSPITLFK